MAKKKQKLTVACVQLNKSNCFKNLSNKKIAEKVYMCRRTFTPEISNIVSLNKYHLLKIFFVKMIFLCEIKLLKKRSVWILLQINNN